MIGITSTIPVEVVFAAGLTPVDLNNIFITSENPKKLIAYSEACGFSHNTCAWIKGIYATVINRGIKEMVAVTGGDCSNSIALGELLTRKGVNVIPFEYPQDRNRDKLQHQMDVLCRRLGTSWVEIKKTKSVLDRIRLKLRRLDEMTWKENKLTGFENHLYLLSSSDFNGDPNRFEAELDLFLSEAEKRAPVRDEIRLGFLGVPPIFSGFYEYIESQSARVVFNEVQRQFSMPYGHSDMVDQYLAYTYPYDVGGRLTDILQAIEERQLDGLIHYTQSFCHRQIYDMVFRDEINYPILTLEENQPGPIDGRTIMRIETFVEMLKGKKDFF